MAAHASSAYARLVAYSAVSPAVAMPPKRAKHVVTPSPVARTAVGKNSAVYTQRDWLNPSAVARPQNSAPTAAHLGREGAAMSTSRKQALALKKAATWGGSRRGGEQRREQTTDS